jgi:hypothetical protein
MFNKLEARVLSEYKRSRAAPSTFCTLIKHYFSFIKHYIIIINMKLRQRICAPWGTVQHQTTKTFNFVALKFAWPPDHRILTDYDQNKVQYILSARCAQDTQHCLLVLQWICANLKLLCEEASDMVPQVYSLLYSTTQWYYVELIQSCTVYFYLKLISIDDSSYRLIFDPGK